MSCTQFICPNHDKILIRQCLRNCPHATRCLSRPTLEALAKSVADRGLGKYSVTELLRGTREVYLEKTTDYAVNPQDMIFATFGTAMHLIGEYNADEDIITETRLENELFTGQVDLYGDILSNGQQIVMDYKTCSAYKAMVAMGYHQVEVATGEVYKTGAKKGQPKTKKQWQKGGVRKLFEWAVQVNAYAMLLQEELGCKVDGLYLQLYIRDYNQRVASEGIITQPIYLVKVNKISHHWLKLYFKVKKRRLEQAMITGEIPVPCSNRETWNQKKCKDYCKVYEECMKAEAKNELDDASQDEAANADTEAA